MKLQDFLGTTRSLNVNQVTNDIELSTQIQIRLIALNLLVPPADGLFYTLSQSAFKDFQRFTRMPQIGVLDAATAKKLIEQPDAGQPRRNPRFCSLWQWGRSRFECPRSTNTKTRQQNFC